MREKMLKELHYQYRCLRLGLGFLTGRFIHCNLQITYRCGFKCRICDFWKTDHDSDVELTLDQIRVIGRKLNRLGTLIVSLAGGEPLERKDILDIIRILGECNHFPILITNGWHIDREMASDLLKAGLQEISVSVDYISPERHDAQRGMPGSWDRAVRALEMLNRARPDKRNRVHMISVLMDDNLEDIEELIKLSREIGVTYMVNLYSSNRGSKEPRLPGREVTAHLLGLKRKYPEFVTLTSYLEQMDRAISEGGIGGCQTGRLLLNIDNRGQVARCTETLDEPVGNILSDGIGLINRRLRKVQSSRECSRCWTSCRGFAECMFKPPRLRQFREFYTSVKPR